MKFSRKKRSHGVIDYFRKNKYLLVIFIYCIIAALFSSRIIIEYGESKFYTIFFLVGLLLMVFLKVASLVTSSENKK